MLKLKTAKWLEGCTENSDSAQNKIQWFQRRYKVAGEGRNVPKGMEMQTRKYMRTSARNYEFEKKE